MKRFSFVGLVAATVFLSASMTPSLVPRHWLFQGIVSGITTATGYGLGALASYVWRRFPEPYASVRMRRPAWLLLATVGPVVVVVMTVLGIGWQRELHRLMGMPIPSAWGYVGAVLLALVLAVLLLGIARAIRWSARHVGAALSRWLSPPLASVLGGVLVGLVLIGFLDGVVARTFFSTADDTFRVSDRVVADDATPPASPLRSGSAASAVAWRDLGSQGREFVTKGPSARELADFSRGSAAEGSMQEPIRVYAGLYSRDRVRDRAALVVDELERTGGFDRAVLCVITTTGTGWVDPQVAAALEYLWGGDTALATMQYSYLPSWLSFLVDRSRAREAGAVLFNTVYERWVELPENDRPLLLVFGESLGVDGSEAAFSGVADLRNRTDGVLWVGPPHFSELWSSFTERRDPGTPQRLPVYDGGATVRFAAHPDDLWRPDAPWYHPRVVYLQHASDPVVWWSPRLILRRADWLVEPPGDDVLPAMRWYPIVTFWQVSGDLANTERVPPGHGHDYGALIANAWAAIAPPPGWSQADTERLHARLAAGHSATNVGQSD